jgi:hypothetical protein
MQSLYCLLNECKQLTTLILDIEDIDHTLLKAIGHCTTLKKLHISHCSASSEQWEDFATQLTNLTDLYLCGKSHSPSLSLSC